MLITVLKRNEHSKMLQQPLMANKETEVVQINTLSAEELSKNE